MTIPPEILSLVEQLIQELDRIEQQANEGLDKRKPTFKAFSRQRETDWLVC